MSGSLRPSEDYDIGPDETNLTTIDVLSLDDNLEIQYEPYQIRRSHNTLHEPLDQGEDILHLPNGSFQEIYDESPMTTGFTFPSPAPLRPATDELYHSEVARLETFRDRWLDDYYVKPKDLARDGFIHVGPFDNVKCVFCLNCLKKWEPCDTVEGEHRKHYPNCPFINGKCQHINIPIDPTENYKQSLGLRLKPVDQPPEDKKSNLLFDFSVRLSTFNTWPASAPIRPDALAQAGLYYMGHMDKVQCYKCHKVLGQWQLGDDPWVEHAKWSPNCDYLLTVRGTEFVKQVTEKQHPLPSASANKMQELKYPVQVPTSQMEKDLKSPQVKAICDIYDVPTETMKQLILAFRSHKDEDLQIRNICESHDVSVEEITHMLDSLRINKDTGKK